MYKNEHKFPYRWTKKDANFTKDKGKVMCFGTQEEAHEAYVNAIKEI